MFLNVHFNSVLVLSKDLMNCLPSVQKIYLCFVVCMCVCGRGVEGGDTVGQFSLPGNYGVAERSSVSVNR